MQLAPEGRIGQALHNMPSHAQVLLDNRLLLFASTFKKAVNVNAKCKPAAVASNKLSSVGSEGEHLPERHAAHPCKILTSPDVPTPGLQH